MAISLTVNGTSYPVPSSAADTNWAADQIAWEQAVTSALAGPTWTAPSLTNSWVNFNSSTDQIAGYYKASNGRVWLRGTIKTGASGTSAFTLPSGYRPTKRETFPISAGDGVFSLGVAQINTDGTVVLTSVLGDVQTMASLAGISFSTT